LGTASPLPRYRQTAKSPLAGIIRLLILSEHLVADVAELADALDSKLSFSRFLPLSSHCLATRKNTVIIG
jgi:hypothetical protein